MRWTEDASPFPKKGSKRCSAPTTRTSSTSNRCSTSGSARRATTCWSTASPRARRRSSASSASSSSLMRDGYKLSNADVKTAARPRRAGRSPSIFATTSSRGASTAGGQAPRGAEDRQPAAVPRRDRAARHRLRHRSGRHRQDLSGDGAGRVVPGREEGQPHHPGAAGGRSGREARLPARRPAGEGEPVPAAALRRAVRHARRRARRRATSSAARSRSRRSRSCAAGRSTTRSSSSTRRRTRRPSR